MILYFKTLQHQKGIGIIILILACFNGYSQQWYTSINNRHINSSAILDNNRIVLAGGNLRNDSIRSLHTSDNLGLVWDIRVDLITAWLRSVAFNDNLNGVSVGYSGGIFKTTDGGSNWQQIASPVNRDFNEVVYVTPQVLIAVGGSNRENDTLQTIIKSEDGGSSWTIISDIQDYWLKSVFFTSISDGIAVGDKGIILSTSDGGESWTPVASPVQRDLNSVCFVNSATGIIAGGKLTNDSIATILRTVDGGENWSVIKDEQGAWLTDISFIDSQKGYVVGNNATLLKTIDGGLTWNPETVDNTTGNEYFESVNFSAENFGIVTGSLGAVYIFSDIPTPQANTLPAYVDAQDVTILGEVNTHGYPGNFRFIFDDNPLLSNNPQTPPIDINSNLLLGVSKYFQGLPAGVTYYYAIKATTIGGTVYGDTLSFQTGVYNPDFQTRVATDITQSTAILNGRVDHFSDTPLTLSFEYGTSIAFGNTVDANPQTILTNQLYDVSASINGLQSNIPYYYRLKGVSSTQTYYGDTRTFFPGNEIPNWDFENWTTTTYQLPTHWSIFTNDFERVQGHSGNYALKLTGVNACLLGVPTMEDFVEGLPFLGGVPYNYRPDSISVFLNYLVQPGDTAAIGYQLYGGDTIYALGLLPITGNSGGVFVEQHFPISYNFPGTPDSLILAFVTTYPHHDAASNSSANNFMIIDDISMLPLGSPPVTYGNFESWYDFVSLEPDEWDALYYLNSENNSGGLPMVTRTEFSPGDYAVEVKNILSGGKLLRAQFSTGPNYFQQSSAPPDFLVLNEYTALNGYYKFFPENGDTMQVEIRMFYQGEPIASGYFYASSEVTEFTPFSLVINYFENLIPDSAEIMLQPCKQNPRGLSRLEIDKLSFGNFVLPVSENIHESLLLYPNPVSDVVFIEWAALVDGAVYGVDVYDVNGRVVYAAPAAAEAGRLRVDAGLLSPGFYLLKVAAADGALHRAKLVVR